MGTPQSLAAKLIHLPDEPAVGTKGGSQTEFSPHADRLNSCESSYILRDRLTYAPLRQTTRSEDSWQGREGPSSAFLKIAANAPAPTPC